MTTTTDEVLAGLRVLICMAKADNVLHDEEKKALAAVLEGLAPAGGVTLESLLVESIDLDEQLALITTPEAKDQVFKSAYSIAHADGTCSPEEQQLLERIQGTLGIAQEDLDAVQRLFAQRGGALAGILSGDIKAIEDPDQRDAAVKKETLKCSVVSAVLGAFPVPGLALATDLVVLALQVGLVQDIAKYYGRDLDKASARNLLYGLGVGTGVRLAASNLLKMIPGWGAAAGAAMSFASTYALGNVMNTYFAKGEDANLEELASEFKDAQKQAKKVYTENKDTIAQKSEDARGRLEQLNQDLKDGNITEAEYEVLAARQTL